MLRRDVMAPDVVAPIPIRRRGRPRKGVFPPTRRQLLDAARRDALQHGFGWQSSAKMRADCGSLSHSHQDDPVRWYCVQTKPGAERDAAARLRDQGFTTFLPMAIADRHRRISAVPAAPRYLFVAFDPTAVQWRCICHTHGVARLFLIGERPAPARRGQVEALMHLVVERNGEPDPAAQAVTAGQVGAVQDGPFSSFRCVVVAQEPDGRITVEVSLFGRPSTITLERDAVRLEGEG